MRNPDLLLYAVHIAFWASFGITRRLLRRQPDAAPETVAAAHEYTAPFSRTVLAFHMLAFGVLYYGIGNAVIPRRVPEWFAGQRIVGTLVIALGAAVMSWALQSFHSWSFRAKLDEGHQLATNGAFRLMRHPIYTGLTLLALGTAIWAPTAVIWSAFVLMAICSELRARSEEVVLKQAFGDAYVAYSKRTRRFLPFVY